ncbi:glycosyltransferase [Clostridium novyi]|uniref:Glycosyltransferase, putative n=1 Tax=Clostridium novyi (strain NT) TaxID=386415 RepID=A0PZ09_CLONN|nr:glycosyltransferase [Clostridium novyi]ABK61759.1 glycosyltransferase, putative [Clostridium novyi NT]KEH86124.1 glycosyl transferase [Clostridium novyi A str. NCTC 538]
MKKVIMAEYFDYNSVFKFGAHHYAKLFAENGYEVLWLLPVYNFISIFNNRETYNMRKSYNKNEFVEVDHNIYTYSPYSMVMYGSYPILKNKIFNKLSLKMTIPKIDNVLKKSGFDKVDILWITNPKYYYLKDMISYKKMIHRCGDDMEEFNKGFNSYIEFENKLIKESDITFVTSKNLMDKKSKIRKDLTYLPNGVDLSNFIRNQYILPKEFESNNNKKCIYVGAIDSWFDVDLVEHCVKKLSGVDFYIIGPEKISLEQLKKYNNIHVLGGRNYKDIPNYLYYSDVAIIPFKVNKLTDSVTPIKLYEYMSVGLNVVTTNFKEMNYIDSPAYVANNYNEFLNNIKMAIYNKENVHKNIYFAKENTWNNRFKFIEKIL